MSRLLFFILAAGFLSGCGRYWEDEEEPRAVQATENHATEEASGEEPGEVGAEEEGSGLGRTTLMEDRALKKRRKTWITAEAGPGDRLLVTIRDVFPEPVEEIRPYDDFYRSIPIDCGALVDGTGLEGCAGVPSYPGCFVRARIRAAWRDAPLMEIPDIGIEMDGRLYPMEGLKADGKDAVSAEFTVTEEMIDPDSPYTSVYFVPYVSGSGGDWTGVVEFVNPEECPGEKERGRVLSNRQSHVSLGTRYHATVVLEKGGGR